MTKDREMEVLRRYVRRLLAESERSYSAWLSANVPPLPLTAPNERK